MGFLSKRRGKFHRPGFASGTVAIEFALIAPILILLLVSVMDFGFAMYEKMRIVNATRAGAQFAVISFANANDTDAIAAIVAATAGKNIADVAVTPNPYCECSDGSAIVCTGTCGASSLPPNVYASVSVIYQHSTILPYPGIDDILTFTEISVLRMR